MAKFHVRHSSTKHSSFKTSNSKRHLQPGAKDPPCFPQRKMPVVFQALAILHMFFFGITQLFCKRKKKRRNLRLWRFVGLNL